MSGPVDCGGPVPGNDGGAVKPESGCSGGLGPGIREPVGGGVGGPETPSSVGVGFKS